MYIHVYIYDYEQKKWWLGLVSKILKSLKKKTECGHAIKTNSIEQKNQFFKYQELFHIYIYIELMI